MENFVLDKDQRDSLKLELSILPSADQEVLVGIAGTIKSNFINRFRDYIPEATINKTSDLEKRVILTDKDAYDVFIRHWPLKKKKISSNDGKLFEKGHLTTLGDLALINDPAVWWDHLFTPSAQQQFIERFGSESKARQIIAGTVFSTIAHEMIHSFQDSKLGNGIFAECGTRFYERIVVRDTKLSYISSPLDDFLIDFYQHLLDEFGDDVHKVFFGLLDDPHKRDSILKLCTEEELIRVSPERYREISESL